MSDSLSSQQAETQTDQFLKTDGPPVGYFAPDPSLEPLLVGKTDLEKRFYRSQSTQGKQNDYIISQVQGLKVVSKVSHDRLASVESRVATIESIASIFTRGRKGLLYIFGFIATVIAGPLLADFLKHVFHWQ
jgi:hypothetical protein